jgi:hypothetical protein
VPLSKSGAALLFEVFSQRYERGSTMVTIRSILRFKNQSMELARQLGAKVLRLEGAAVHNQDIILLTEKMAFKRIEGTPSSFLLELPVQ